MTTEQIQQTITNTALQYGVPPDIALAVARKESNYNPAAKSGAGAIGVMQLMPAVARNLGVDPYDPAQNIEGGIKLLAEEYKRFGSWDLALAAYNAGSPAVKKAGNQVPNFPETQDYVSTILGWLGIKGGEYSPPFKTAWVVTKGRTVPMLALAFPPIRQLFTGKQKMS